MTRDELAAMMEKAFGPDWERKVLVGPVSSFPLADVYEECGFRPPSRPDHSCHGLWQISNAPLPRKDRA